MKSLENKLSGSYYTPDRTVRFMKNYLHIEHQYYTKILEPSAGDGRFIDAFCKSDEIEQLTAVELDEKKTTLLREKKYSDKVVIINDDFLDYAFEVQCKFHLIIGNPPYINIKNMESSTLEKAKKLCDRFHLPYSMMKNVWVAFLLAAVSCLRESGVIFLVLPMEFLQVQYAEKIRIFLEERFNTIHILTFREAMFPQIEQEACLVYLTNENNREPNINFKIYRQLDSQTPFHHSVIQRNKPLKKWTNAILSDQDIDVLERMRKRYIRISDICEASPGIVTGANNEFILNSDEVESLQCGEYILPIIPKGGMLRGKFILNREVVKRLGEENERIYLLNLSKTDPGLYSEELIRYLNTIGEKENSSGIKLKERYKCRNRKPWYGVPIVANGDLFFFKRYDKLPKLCINEADLYTTDIAYNMRLKGHYDKRSAAFCFYNSLTLAQCEYYGRYYAGGVSELIPSEFKELAIPYKDICEEDILCLDRMFQENAASMEIIRFVNSRTIGKDLPLEQINQLDSIRKRLMDRRITKKEKK